MIGLQHWIDVSVSKTNNFKLLGVEWGDAWMTNKIMSNAICSDEGKRKVKGVKTKVSLIE